MKFFFFKLLFLCFPICLVLLGVDTYYRYIYDLPYKIPSKLLPNREIENKYQIVKVGNSHAMDGITFEGYKLSALDLSNVAQKFEIDLAFLKQHRAEIQDDAIILIAVTPISFSHTDVNATRGLQAEYYGRISPFLIPHLQFGDYLESEFFPFVRSGYFLRQKYAEKDKQRMNAEVETPEPTQTNIEAVEIKDIQKKDELLKNRVQAPTISPNSSDYYLYVEAIEKELASPSATMSEYTDNVNFTYTKWTATDEFSKNFFTRNRYDLEKLIRYCLRKNWRPVVVTIPITDELEKALPQDYKQVYLYDNVNKTDLQGADYLDFSNDSRIKNNKAFFSNSDHLNQKGSIILSYILLKELIGKGYLSPEANGYNYQPLPINVNN